LKDSRPAYYLVADSFAEAGMMGLLDERRGRRGQLKLSAKILAFLFSRVREVARRVKCWQGGTMILRWIAAGVLEAERHFRKVAGYRALPRLAAALHKRDAVIDRAPGVDNRTHAA
jgi:hypothetical protein